MCLLSVKVTACLMEVKKMNRQQALDWCVEKYLQWPVGDTHYYYAPDGWKWRIDFNNHISLVKEYGILTVVNEKEWLEAKAAKRSKSMSASNVVRETEAIPECETVDLSSYGSEKWQPEIGQECQYQIGSLINKGTYVGINARGSFVVEDDCGEYKGYHPNQVKFRPLRTKEEIDREAFINQFVSDDFICQCELLTKSIAASMYDKGYRKK